LIKETFYIGKRQTETDIKADIRQFIFNNHDISKLPEPLKIDLDKAFSNFCKKHNISRAKCKLLICKREMKRTSGGREYWSIPIEIVSYTKDEIIDEVKLLILYFIEDRYGQELSQICKNRFGEFSLSPKRNPKTNQIVNRSMQNYWLPKLFKYHRIKKYLIKGKKINDDLSPVNSIEEVEKYLRKECKIKKKDMEETLYISINNIFIESLFYPTEELNNFCKENKIVIPKEFRELSVYEFRILIALLALSKEDEDYNNISRNELFLFAGAKFTSFSNSMAGYTKYDDALKSLTKLKMPIIKRDYRRKIFNIKQIDFVQPLSIEALKKGRLKFALSKHIKGNGSCLLNYKIFLNLELIIKIIRGDNAILDSKDILYFIYAINKKNLNIQDKDIFEYLRFKESSLKDKRFKEKKEKEFLKIESYL